MKAMKQFIIFILLIAPLTVQSQIGGQHAYSFLELAYSAKSLALGGDIISIVDEDAYASIDNPALLSPKSNKNLSIHEAILPGRINYGMLHYTKSLKDD